MILIFISSCAGWQANSKGHISFSYPTVANEIRIKYKKNRNHLIRETFEINRTQCDFYSTAACNFTAFVRIYKNQYTLSRKVHNFMDCEPPI